MADRWKNDIKEDSKLERALEEAKKQMAENNKRFSEAMKEIKENWTKQTEEYKEITNLFKDKDNKFSFVELLSGGLNNKQSQIGEKYSALRRGVDSDVMEDITTSLTDYMMKQFFDAINLINYWVKYCYCLVLISSPFSL